MRQIAQAFDALQADFLARIEQLHAALGAFDDQAEIAGAAQVLGEGGQSEDRQGRHSEQVFDDVGLPGAVIPAHAGIQWRQRSGFPHARE